MFALEGVRAGVGDRRFCEAGGSSDANELAASESHRLLAERLEYGQRTRANPETFGNQYSIGGGGGHSPRHTSAFVACTRIAPFWGAPKRAHHSPGWPASNGDYILCKNGRRARARAPCAIPVVRYVILQCRFIVNARAKYCVAPRNQLLRCSCFTPR